MAPSLCLCCFQTLFLNNSVVSHCSFQLFLPCDPPESKETTHPSTSVCAAPACACVLRSILCSFSHVALYSGNCICPAPRAAFFFPPSRSSSLWCQVEASAEGAGAGLCEKLLFDVPSVASSHEVEGKLCTTAMA